MLQMIERLPESRDIKKIVAVHQPNYMPWLGFFYKMDKCDIFFLLDTVQYSKQSPANRNYILGRDGKPVMLTASVKKPHIRKYSEIGLDYSSKWNLNHLNKLRDSYYATAYFKKYYSLLEEALIPRYDTLAELNINLIKLIKNELGIRTELKVVSALSYCDIPTEPNERHIALCKYVGGTHYLSGMGAQKYNDMEVFNKHEVKLIYSDFNHPVYTQRSTSFVPNLSILDLMFNEGDRSLDILRGNGSVYHME